MNIEDKSQSLTWSNTTSTELTSKANDTFPWYAARSDWDPQRGGLNSALFAHGMSRALQSLYQVITPDTPVSRSATLTTSERGNYNWPLWMFAVVAAMLTFGSIFVPLVGPRTYRSIARFSLRRKRTFRMIVSLLWTT
jgi:hypothetical protein